MTVSGGDVYIISGDDGIHGDTDVTVSGGGITVVKSYEGIESTNIVLSGGKTRVNASDDGLNAAGGNDGSSMGGRTGMGVFGPGAPGNNGRPNVRPFG